MPWSKSEDDLLRSMVEACRVGNDIPWRQVAYYFEGRTIDQIRCRWQRSISPDLRKGQWSKDEDMMLLAAFKRHGPNWVKICSYLPGRTNCQCCDRYKNTLNPDIIFGGWTKDEDLKLLRLVKKYGEGKWAKIAQEIDGRIDLSVYQRFQVMKRKKPDILDYVDPDVMADANILPTIISRVGNCRTAFKRRKEAYDALNAYLKSENQDEKVAETSQVRMLDRLLESGQSLLKVKQREKRTYKSRKRIKTEEEAEVDDALDHLLAPFFIALHGPLFKEKYVSINGGEYLRAAAAKLFLLKLFKCGDEANKEIDIPEENHEAFEETKEKVNKVFKNLIVGTHCESIDCVPVIPPNKATLNGFKISLINRNRLALSAEKLKDFDIIPILTSEPMHCLQSKCLDCMKKQDSMSYSQGTEETESNRMLSYETEKMSADVDSCTKLLPPLMIKRRKSTQGPCKACERTNEFKQDFQLLKMRFLATFLWPAFLSTLAHDENRSDTLNELNGNETEDEENSLAKINKVCRRKNRRKKRPQKKPWVTEFLKNRHLQLQHTLRETKPKQAPIKRKGKYNLTSKTHLPTRRSTRHVSNAVIDL